MFLDRGSTRRKPTVKSTEKGPRPRPGLKPQLSSFPEIHLAFAEQKVNTLADWKKKSNKILKIFIRVLKNNILKNNENNLKNKEKKILPKIQQCLDEKQEVPLQDTNTIFAHLLKLLPSSTYSPGSQTSGVWIP